MTLHNTDRLADSRDRGFAAAIAHTLLPRFEAETVDEDSAPLDDTLLPHGVQLSSVLYNVADVTELTFSLHLWGCTGPIRHIECKGVQAVAGARLVDIVVALYEDWDTSLPEDQIPYRVTIIVLNAIANEAFVSAKDTPGYNANLNARVNRLLNEYQVYNPREDEGPLAAKLQLSQQSLFAPLSDEDEPAVTGGLRSVYEAFRKYIATHVYSQEQTTTLRTSAAFQDIPANTVCDDLQLQTTTETGPAPSDTTPPVLLTLAGFTTLKYTLFGAMQRVPLFRRTVEFRSIKPTRVVVRQELPRYLSLLSFLNRSTSHNVLQCTVLMLPPRHQPALPETPHTPTPQPTKPASVLGKRRPDERGVSSIALPQNQSEALNIIMSRMYGGAGQTGKRQCISQPTASQLMQ